MAHAVIAGVAYSLIDLLQSNSQALILAPLGSVLFLIGTLWRRRQSLPNQQAESPVHVKAPHTALTPCQSPAERIAS
jgi:hypothetical protein